MATPAWRCSVPDPTRETWLPVPGWEGLYEVSDLGRIRSLKRGTVSGVRGGRILSQHLRRRYLAVLLSRPGTRFTVNVHRLVLAAFAGPCPQGQQTRHGRGGALDNRLVNLSYGTPAENMADKVRDGTVGHIGPSGERNGNAKLTAAIVDECRSCRAAGVTIAALARLHGVDQSTMSVALAGKTWRRS
jgi:NUMOD4 motif